MYLIDYIYNVLNEGYFYVVLFLLIAYLIIKKKRSVLKEIIITSNGLWLITYLLFIINSIYILYPLVQPFNDDRDVFFSYRISGPYSFSFWILLLVGLTTFILLLFRKYRKSIRITIWLVLFSAPFNYEKLIIWITSLYRDYLPSSWSVYHKDFFHNYPWLIYLLILTVTHFIRQFFIKRKTPESANLQQ